MITFLIIMAILFRPRHYFYGPRMFGSPPHHHMHHHDMFGPHDHGGFGGHGPGRPGMF